MEQGFTPIVIPVKTVEDRSSAMSGEGQHTPDNHGVLEKSIPNCIFNIL